MAGSKNYYPTLAWIKSVLSVLAFGIGNAVTAWGSYLGLEGLLVMRIWDLITLILVFREGCTATELSAVTAACLMVNRSKFQQVGGFNPKLAVAFNDVDFCLRLKEAGYANVWTPYAELIHHESASRGARRSATKAARLDGEKRYMWTRWKSIIDFDPAYNLI